MRIEVDGNLYYLEFSYHDRATVCEILALRDADDKEGEHLGGGMVRCHPNDEFEKSEGRKRALTRALSVFVPDPRARVPFYEAYFARVKNGDKIIARIKDHGCQRTRSGTPPIR